MRKKAEVVWGIIQVSLINDLNINKQDRTLLHAVSRYERDLISLVETKIKNKESERQFAVLQENLKQTKKELAEHPKNNLREKIDELETRLYFELSHLEGYTNELSSKEKSLELSKEKLKEAKEKAAQIRLQYQNNQQ